ncbi:UNVERIFIED_CONTAM: Structure-specific endonuclease subunit SLX1 [Siphonaria sp. JEL0065]|nr:Structure-specific endonuclease subunit SLX1 [Siphonaria sp. JEL0065]
MVVIVHGFPNKIAALQFEWAWQKPHQSRHFNTQSSNYTKARKDQDINVKLQVLADMVLLDNWSRWPLRIHITSEGIRDYFERLPGVEAVGDDLTFGPLLSLPFRSGLEEDIVAKFEGVLMGGTKCCLCKKSVDRMKPLSFSICTATPGCQMVSHLSCLAHDMIGSETVAVGGCPFQIIPVKGSCPVCFEMLVWGDLINCQDMFHHMHGDGVGEMSDNGSDASSDAE